MNARDELFEALIDVAEKYDFNLTNSPAMRPGVPELGDFLGDIEGAILAAGYRKPRTITTAEELDALPVDSVVMEAEEDTFVIRTMRGVFHRFPDGWYVVAGHGAREDIHFPATVLHEGA